MPSQPIKRILVVRNDRFGEFLLNIPAFRALKETFPEARLTAVIDPYVRELAECIPYLDELMEWPRIKHSLFEKLRLISLLKKKKLGLAVMLNPSQEFNIFTYLAGIPMRIGYNRKWGFLLTHKIEDEKHLGQRHEVEYNLKLVSLAGAKTEDETLTLDIVEDAAQSNIKGKDDLIAIHPFTSDPVKQWPLENFKELAIRLIDELGVRIALVGGKEELNKDREIFDGVSDKNLINMIGKTNLRQLALLLKRCKLLISCDSGPVHLGVAVGTKVLAIFRSDIPGKGSKRWGPRGEGHIVIEKAKLSDISVEEVFKAVQEKLNQ